jgi:hypothetical protein
VEDSKDRRDERMRQKRYDEYEEDESMPSSMKDADTENPSSPSDTDNRSHESYGKDYRRKRRRAPPRRRYAPIQADYIVKVHPQDHSGVFNQIEVPNTPMTPVVADGHRQDGGHGNVTPPVLDDLAYEEHDPYTCFVAARELPSATTDDEERVTRGGDRPLSAPIQAWEASRKNLVSRFMVQHVSKYGIQSTQTPDIHTDAPDVDADKMTRVRVRRRTSEKADPTARSSDSFRPNAKFVTEETEAPSAADDLSGTLMRKQETAIKYKCRIC